MDLTHARHAFITGGASGIGLGIADALAARGIAVTLADIDQPVLDEVLRQRGARHSGVRLDVRDRAQWAAAKQAAEAKFGPVDILVNNAGIGPDGQPLADMDAESFDRIVAINLTGVFNGVHAFGAALRAQCRGHIVNTASIAGLATGFPGLGGYAATKHAVVALSEVLRLEMAPQGVGVSVLCPGLVPTNLGQTTQKLGSRVRVALAQMGSDGLGTAEVAAHVLAAIAEDRLYVITHPHRWSGVEPRLEAIREAFSARRS